MAIKVEIKQKSVLTRSITMEEIASMQSLSCGVWNQNYVLERDVTGDRTVLYNPRHLARGIHVVIQKQSVCLYLPIPTTRNEVKIFYYLVMSICDKLDIDCFYRNDERVALNQVSDCIQLDQQNSIACLMGMKEMLQNGKFTSFYMFGALNPLSLGKTEVFEIDGSLDKLDELLVNTQHLDFIFAEPQYLKNDSENVKCYMLWKDDMIIFPIDDSYDEEPFEIHKKIIVLENMVAIEWNEFQSFIKDCERYDETHVLFTLNMDMLNQIAGDIVLPWFKKEWERRNQQKVEA